MTCVYPLYSSFFFFYRYPPHPHLHSFPTRRSSDLTCIILHAGRLFTNRVQDICSKEREVFSELFMHIIFCINRDRKSTRLNSSHVRISYAVFCLKKKNTRKIHQ